MMSSSLFTHDERQITVHPSRYSDNTGFLTQACNLRQPRSAASKPAMSAGNGAANRICAPVTG